MKPAEALHRRDIQDAGYEEPNPGVFFDSKRDISSSDIDLLRKEFQVSKNSSGVAFIYYARYLKIFDPSFNPDQELTTVNREAIRQRVRDTKGSDWINLQHLLRCAIDLDPSIIPKNKIPPLVFEVMQKEMTIHRQADRWWSFIELANVMKGLDPNFNLATEVTQHDRLSIREMLKKSRESIDRSHWIDFANLASDLYEIDPSFHLDEEITPSDCQGMQEKLSDIREVLYRKDYMPGTITVISDYFSLARAMKILSQGMKTAPPTQERSLPTIKTY